MFKKKWLNLSYYFAYISKGIYKKGKLKKAFILQGIFLNKNILIFLTFLIGNINIDIFPSNIYFLNVFKDDFVLSQD